MVTPNQVLRKFDNEERKSQSVFLPLSLIDRGRGIVGHGQYFGGPPGFTTLAELYTWALDRGFAELEDKYHGGAPFPRPQGRLSTGPGNEGISRIKRGRRKDDGSSKVD